jgi:hypothetical protein
MGQKCLIAASGHANLSTADAATLAAAVETFRVAVVALIPDAKILIQTEPAPTPAD